MDRLNHFPASPLVTITIVLEGSLKVISACEDLNAIQLRPALPQISVTGPQTAPLTSWSEAPVHAISLGFYPDAWMRLTGDKPKDLIDQTGLKLPDTLEALLSGCCLTDRAQRVWDDFCAALAPLWSGTNDIESKTSKARLSDWVGSLLMRSAFTGPGKSLRAAQRRLERWSGHSKQSLEFFARFEQLHSLSQQDRSASPAELAYDAGFADQSHMGRAVRRMTGHSPVRLNQLIETQEAFWCYRLLGERF